MSPDELAYRRQQARDQQVYNHGRAAIPKQPLEDEPLLHPATYLNPPEYGPISPPRDWAAITGKAIGFIMAFLALTVLCFATVALIVILGNFIRSHV